jgi:hypothetical protein
VERIKRRNVLSALARGCQACSAPALAQYHEISFCINGANPCSGHSTQFTRWRNSGCQSNPELQIAKFYLYLAFRENQLTLLVQSRMRDERIVLRWAKRTADQNFIATKPRAIFLPLQVQ